MVGTTLRDLISQKLDVESLDDLPDEVIRDTLEGVEGTMAEKIDAIAGLMNSWTRSEDAIGLEIKRLQKRKGSFANRRQRLKAYLGFQLTRLNQPKIETDLHTVYLRKGQQSVVIDDESALDVDYFKTEVRIDKAAIKADLKDGDVTGAHLERGPDTVVVS